MYVKSWINNEMLSYCWAMYRFATGHVYHCIGYIDPANSSGSSLFQIMYEILKLVN